MALSATFTANFSSFYDAVDKADAKLKTFGDGADKVGGRLNTLANQFSGQKVVQEATLMVKAVEEIGGVSKLTEKELARLGATTNEAVEKMKALGMDVPKNLQKIADQTKGATKATTDWMGSLTKAAGVVGIAFSVDAVVNFIGSVFDAASAVKDLSDQWGVSTTAVQQWTGAAKQSGVEAETVGKSVQFLTQELGEGSDAYQALLKNVGLSYEQLRQMPLEDAYQEVIKAIGGIKDETQQLDIAQGLLGASSKKMVGAIRDGFLDAAAATSYMSDETIKRLEAAQASWEKFKNALVIGTGEILAATSMITESMTRSWSNFFKIAAAGIADTFSGQHTGAALVVMDQAANSTKKSLEGVATATTTVTKTTAQVLELAGAHTKAADAAAAHAKAIEATGRAISREGVLDAMNQMAAEITAAAKSGGLARDALERYGKQIQAWLMQGYQVPSVLRDTYREFSILTATITTTSDATKLLNTVGGDVAPQLRAQAAAAKDLADQYREVAKAVSGDVAKLLASTSDLNVKLPPLPTEKVDTFEQSLHRLAGAFAQLAQVSDGAFGEVTQDIAMVVAAMDVAAKSAETFHAGLGQIGKGHLTAGFAQTAAGAAGVVGAFQSATKETGKLQSTLNGAAIGFSVAGPWGAAVGAGIGLLKGFFNEAKKRKELINLRDDFIKTSGGILQLADAARKAGTSVSALLTAKNTDELQKAIRDLNAAVQFQEDALQLAIDTAERYGFTLEELGPAMARQQLDKQAQQLYKDWQVLNSAGLDTVAITKRMSEAISKYVQDASKMGTEVPDAMRPMLEAMAKSGTLLDENGNAITDLEAAGIKFTLSMSDGFKELIKQVEKLTDAILRGLGLAIENVPELKIPIRFTYPPGTPGGGEDPGTGGPGPPRGPIRLPVPDAFVDWGSVPAGSTGTSSAPINITVVSQLDGRELARNQVKYIPGELNRAGV